MSCRGKLLSNPSPSQIKVNVPCFAYEIIFSTLFLQTFEAVETGQAEVGGALQPDRKLLAGERRYSEVHRVLPESFGRLTQQRRSFAQPGKFLNLLEVKAFWCCGCLSTMGHKRDLLPM